MVVMLDVSGLGINQIKVWWLEMVGEVGRCGPSSLSRLYHTRLATPFYSHKEISSDKRGVAWW